MAETKDDVDPELEAMQQEIVKASSDGGSHLDLLKSLRKRISYQVGGDCPPRDLASLSRRLQDLSKEITGVEERLKQDERESNPCKACGGTGVGRRGDNDGTASTNDAWRPS